MTKRVFPREAFAIHEERSAKIRRYLVSYVKRKVPTDTPAVFLSGGADSHLVLFAALHAGKTPTVFSCTMDDRESRDFRSARNTAKLFGLKFVPVLLPSSEERLIKYVKMMYSDELNPGLYVGKTTMECVWPVAHMMRKAYSRGHRDFLTGMGGDTWFSTIRSQRKAYLAGTYQKLLDHERSIVCQPPQKSIEDWEGRDPQDVMVYSWRSRYAPDSRYHTPFETAKMFDIMEGLEPIKEGWKPIQKAPWRLAFFEEFEKARESVFVNSPMQKGDSGIEEHFQKLLKSKLNIRGSKNAVGIYNDQLELWRARHITENSLLD